MCFGGKAAAFAWSTAVTGVGSGVGVDFPSFNHYPDARVNLIANHGFESSLDGWTGFRADIARIESGGGHVARITSTTDTATSSLLDKSDESDAGFRNFTG